MKLLGIYCGIGSMMMGAKKQGWEIVGGFDDRPFFHTGTFEHNFDIPLYKDRQVVFDCKEPIDLVIGHTSCGAYSKFRNIQGQSRKDELLDDRGDIPSFIEMVKHIKPKFFVLDNLPGAVNAVNYLEWIADFPEYDIFFEYVSNYHYGNVQKGRNRLFIIGAKKSLGYVFVPGEEENNKTVGDVLKGLPLYDDIRKINHMHLPDDTLISMKHKHIDKDSDSEEKLTLGEWKEWIKDLPPRTRFPYYSDSGDLKVKPGNYKVSPEEYCGVITGENKIVGVGLYRHDTLNPFTVRERARLQGCPDDFIFQPLDYIHEWKIHRDLKAQTGKFIPVQFCTYITKQIKNFLENNFSEKDQSGKRLIKHNQQVSQTKFMYCKNTKYSNQELACEHCWMICRR